MAIPSGPARLGARRALGDFRDVIRHQREAGAGAGRETARTAATLLAAGDAFEPAEKVTQEIGRLLQPRTAEPEAGMHVHAQRRLRAAERARFVVLDRLIGRLHDPRRLNAESV